MATAKQLAARKKFVAMVKAKKGKNKKGKGKKVYDPKDKRMETPAQMKKEGEVPPKKKSGKSNKHKKAAKAANKIYG